MRAHAGAGPGLVPVREIALRKSANERGAVRQKRASPDSVSAARTPDVPARGEPAPAAVGVPFSLVALSVFNLREGTQFALRLNCISCMELMQMRGRSSFTTFRNQKILSGTRNPNASERVVRVARVVMESHDVDGAMVEETPTFF